MPELVANPNDIAPHIYSGPASSTLVLTNVDLYHFPDVVEQGTKAARIYPLHLKMRKAHFQVYVKTRARANAGLENYQ